MELQFCSICDGVAVSTSAYDQTVVSQILIDLAKGLEQGSLVVGNAVRDAVGPDYFLNLAEFVRGHGRKQVVFNLAGEAAGTVIDPRMVLNVPAGDDLLTQEVYRGAALQQRHALMIRRKY